MAQNIKETFAKELATGKVVVTEVMDTKVAEQKRIEIAQLVKGDSPNLIGIMQGNTGGTVLVAWMPIKAEIASAKKLKAGDIFDEKFAEELSGVSANIQVTEKTEPFTWLEGGRFIRVNKNAKMNKSGEDGKYLTKDSNYIFRQTELVAGPANNTKVQHDGLTATPPDYEVLEAVLQNQVAEEIATHD